MSSARQNPAFAALLLIILIAVPVYIYGFRSTHPPSTQTEFMIGDLQVRSTSVSITSTGLSGVSLSLKAVVYNPNVIGATLDAVNYSVYANGHYVGTGHTAREYDIAPQSSQTLVFPISAGWGSAFQTMGSYIMNLGSVTWKVNGSANFDVGGFPLFVPFELATG